MLAALEEAFDCERAGDESKSKSKSKSKNRTVPSYSYSYSYSYSGSGSDPVSLVRSDRNRHWIRFDREAVSAAELIAAVSARLPLIDLAIEEPEIEGIIARIYREGL